MITKSTKFSNATVEMAELTPRQQDVLDMVRDCSRMGVVPTYRQIMAEFGWTATNSAAGFLKSLAAKGWLEQDPKSKRAITILGRFPGGASGVKVQGDFLLHRNIENGDVLVVVEGKRAGLNFTDGEAIEFGGCYDIIGVVRREVSDVPLLGSEGRRLGS